MRDLFEPVVTILAGVIGVAILAVLVSKNAQTPQVLASAGGAFSNILSAATSPVTGNSAAPNVNAGVSNMNSFLPSSSGSLFGGGFPLSLTLSG